METQKVIVTIEMIKLEDGKYYPSQITCDNTEATFKSINGAFVLPYKSIGECFKAVASQKMLDIALKTNDFSDEKQDELIDAITFNEVITMQNKAMAFATKMVTGNHVS